MKKTLVLFLFLWKNDVWCDGGILQPRPSETREQFSLDGLWYFTTNKDSISNIELASDLDINLMPVPSSYNDITTNPNLRDHVGSVWYNRKFFVPDSWQNKRVWIRFGSVCYSADVVINGILVVHHEVGHYPFVADVSSVLNYGLENNITVTVDNTPSSTTIPQGGVETLITNRKKLTYTYDYFNYAGIDRSVVLYTTNQIYIDDVKVLTAISNATSATVTYNVTIVGNSSPISIKLKILDKAGKTVASDESQESYGNLTIPEVKLWWPHLMDPAPGYLYSLKIDLYEKDQLVDTYTQPFGVRELTFDDTSFKINGKNVYIRGFGKHEDSDIRGKGFDLALVLRDYNLLKWIGANAFRTSHYPYAEEIMDLADQLGIMVIDEVPAINLDDYNDELLENHKRSLTDLYHRDKNRPSVIMWSVANEPRSQKDEATDYFRHVVAHIKSFDKTRPVTVCNMYTYNEDHSGQFLDILSVNRYYAWYNNVAELDGIYKRLIDECRSWNKLHNKPVLISEYGADSEEGLHILPTYIWSEEFQNDLMAQHFRAFDEMRNEGWFIGEMIWNFADFKTDQEIRRVGGNKKGVFTRNRQPKSSAFLLRKRYWALAQAIDNVTAPSDIQEYVIDDVSSKMSRDEF
ncbi:beta-glucuronidase-like [Cylas formicarius]|uniref:beta-glucuronidase-like n=1 Tax=Cylas formicarius TaxID=197179 RepID=UPI00295861A3|nr:beta-glucuronidase-like [Cylas formicarius]